MTSELFFFNFLSISQYQTDRVFDADDRPSNPLSVHIMSWTPLQVDSMLSNKDPFLFIFQIFRISFPAVHKYLPSRLKSIAVMGVDTSSVELIKL